MLNILISWGSPFRAIAVMIDSVAFTLIDQAYNVIVAFSSASLFKDETIQSVMNNTYIVIGIFALFRIAMLLVNAIINPDKLNEKGNGLGNVLANLIVMFVMLIMVPILFKEAYSLQETIVSGNYIQKIFLNSDSLDNINPGDTMRSIAIGSLITIDEEAQKQYKAGNCSKNCNKAIESYNDMAKKNNFEFTKLGKYIGVTIKDDDGNTVYVYNYMFVLTFLCGAAITYVLFSFGIDIAVRMVELAILQILAPMFIATYIDPKSAKTGPFHKWLTTVGKTYASLFIKLAALSLMLLFVSLLNGGLKQDIHGFNKLILLFAILIFAKKAPSWIGGMIGVEGEGLGGLGIGKKLKDGLSLLDNPVTRTAAGFAGAAIGNRLANRRRTKALKKEAGVDGRKNRRAKKQEIMRDGWTDKDGNKITGKGAYSAYLKDKGLNMGAKSMRNIIGMGNAMISGAKGGKDAGNFIGAIKGGVKASGEFAHSKGMNEQGLISKGMERVSGIGQKMNQIAYGSGADIYDKNEEAKKIQNRKDWYTEDALKRMGGAENKNLAGGTGGVMDAITDANGVRAITDDDAYAMIRARGEGISVNKIKYDGDGNLQIEGISDLKKYSSEARNMVTPTGAAHLDELFNKSQTNVINEYKANQETINNGAQNLNSTNETVSRLLEGFGAVRDGFSRNAKTGAMEITGVDGAGIVIDPRNLKSSLNGLEMKTNQDFLNAKNEHGAGRMTDEAFRESTERASRIQSFVNDIRNDSSISQQMEIQSQLTTTIDEIIERQKVLKPTYDYIGAEKNENGNYEPKPLTMEQKLEKLALDQDKFSKRVKGIEQKKEESSK